jgi:hypothetical protein
MQPKAKENSVITSDYDDVKGALIFTVLGAGTIELTIDRLSQSVRDWAMIHGLVQRISDKAAKGKNPHTGLPATPADKFAAMKALADHYLTGTEEWDARASGERLDNIILTAVASLNGQTIAELTAKALSDAKARNVKPSDIIKAWGGIAKVATKVAELRAAATGLDAIEMEKELFSE